MDCMLVQNMASSLAAVARPEEVAARTKVTLSTVNRWIAGKSSPRPKQESLLREMYREFFPEGNTPDRDEKLDKCLIQLREIFHKSSRLSSRNEALEEIAKLFFSHITSVLQHGTGICSKMVAEKGKEAESLIDFVSSQFNLHLGKNAPADLTFALNLKKTENQFASEIIAVFEQYYSETEMSAIEALKGTDVLNEIFGKFLANSFVDEKQLGQYLTPHEVVAFSTELLFSELRLEDITRDAFGMVLDPSCGIGSFLASFINKAYGDSVRKNTRFDISKFLHSNVVGIDKSERMVKLGLINLAMYGCADLNMYLRNALDAEDLDLDGNVSVIMTNPPYGAEFPASETEDFRIVSEWPEKKPKKINSEILFIEKYLDWLKPNGFLICIVPDSILNNKGLYQTLRKGISREVSIKAVISLPPNTFATTGTETKTSLLFLQKKKYSAQDETYLAICKNIGYDVVTSGTHKVKKYNNKSDLGGILQDYCQRTNHFGEWIAGINECSRWDAAYHASISGRFIALADARGLLRVKDVAALSREKFNPAQYEADRTFHYIEISDIDLVQMRAYGKEVRCGEAPSRARKLVHRRNILFSTVRPERGTVAVIDDTQDNYVCTTGFAVLEAKNIAPMVLAYLLQSEFVMRQISKYAIGISYPAIDENDLMEIYLPLNSDGARKYDSKAAELMEKELELMNLRREFKQAINADIMTWN